MTKGEAQRSRWTFYEAVNSGHPYSGQEVLEGNSPVSVPLDQDEDPDPDVVQFTLHALPDGEHFFAVTASNSEGIESDYSNEVSTSSSQVSTSNSAQAAGGGGCFVVTAACGH
jgi:hypothetical protein